MALTDTLTELIAQKKNDFTVMVISAGVVVCVLFLLMLILTFNGNLCSTTVGKVRVRDIILFLASLATYVFLMTIVFLFNNDFLRRNEHIRMEQDAGVAVVVIGFVFSVTGLLLALKWPCENACLHKTSPSMEVVFTERVDVNFFMNDGTKKDSDDDLEKTDVKNVEMNPSSEPVSNSGSKVAATFEVSYPPPSPTSPKTKGVSKPSAVSIVTAATQTEDASPFGSTKDCCADDPCWKYYPDVPARLLRYVHRQLDPSSSRSAMLSQRAFSCPLCTSEASSQSRRTNQGNCPYCSRSSLTQFWSTTSPTNDPTSTTICLK